MTRVMSLMYDENTHAARLLLHMKEYTKCIVWCLNAGPDFHPAFENKHKAPCNVDNFYFKEMPWLANGAVNPNGVPPAPFDYDLY